MKDPSDCRFLIFDGNWFHAAGADTAKDRRPKFVDVETTVYVKAVRWKGWWGLWREGFKEKLSFEFRVEMSRSDGQFNCFRIIFQCCWRDNVKPLHYFCNTFPLA